MAFKAEDRVQNKGLSSNTSNPNSGKFASVYKTLGDYTYVRYDDGSYGEGDAHHYRLIKSESPTFMASLKDKFALVFKGEPEKSFIKAGVMNTDESLTVDGKDLLLAYLLKKNGDDFKKTVVDPILAADKEDAD